MSSESNFIEITELGGTQRFVNKSQIVDFYFNPQSKAGCITTVLGGKETLMIDKAEYEKFCEKMKVQKKTNHLLTN